MLDTWFPAPELIPAGGPGRAVACGQAGGTVRLSAAEAAEALGPEAAALLGPDEARGVEVVAVRTTISRLAAPPADAHDAYLRLHLLSGRLVRPRGCNLDGIFGLLANVVWTSHGPCPVPGFEATRLRLRRRGPVTVHGVDKFPRMVDYVLPAGVRIADADRVRLGAHLAEGTTVMHEGFVNYNAGTLGTSMVEGRISAGVVVGERLRRGRRRIDHGHPVRRGHGDDLGRRTVPDRRERRHRHLAGRRLRGRGRAVRDGGHQGPRCRTGRWSRPGSCPDARGCCGCATRRPARSGSPSAPGTAPP